MDKQRESSKKSTIPIKESDIVKAIRDYLNYRGIYHFKNLGCLGQEPGRPDIIACVRGYFVAIEVKKPGGKPSKQQEETLENIRRCGGLAIIATSAEEAIEIIEKVIRSSF